MFIYTITFDYKTKEDYWNRVSERFGHQLPNQEEVVKKYWEKKYNNINKHFISITSKEE